MRRPGWSPQPTSRHRPPAAPSGDARRGGRGLSSRHSGPPATYGRHCGHDDHVRHHALGQTPCAGRPADHHPAREVAAVMAAWPRSVPDALRRAAAAATSPGGSVPCPTGWTGSCEPLPWGPVRGSADRLLSPAVQRRRGLAAVHAAGLGDAAGRPGRAGTPRRRARTGTRGVEAAFGRSFHSYLDTHPDEAERYRTAMESTVDSFTAGARAYDFSQHDTVVDVGGGLGGLLLAVLREHPDVARSALRPPTRRRGCTRQLLPSTRRVTGSRSSPATCSTTCRTAPTPTSTRPSCAASRTRRASRRCRPVPVPPARRSGPGGRDGAARRHPALPVRARRRLRHGGVRRQGPHRGASGAS